MLYRKYLVSRCRCGAELEKSCVHKLASDFDRCKKTVSFIAVLETGRCPRCRARAAAPSPFRDGPVRHRNVRHQITTPEGRGVFSRLLTFVMTCGMNGIFPCRAIAEMLRDPGWGMFNPEPPAPRDGSVFDAPVSELARPPGGVAGQRPARRAGYRKVGTGGGRPVRPQL